MVKPTRSLIGFAEYPLIPRRPRKTEEAEASTDSLAETWIGAQADGDFWGYIGFTLRVALGVVPFYRKGYDRGLIGVALGLTVRVVFRCSYKLLFGQRLGWTAPRGCGSAPARPPAAAGGSRTVTRFLSSTLLPFFLLASLY